MRARAMAGPGRPISLPHHRHHSLVESSHRRFQVCLLIYINYNAHVMHTISYVPPTMVNKLEICMCVCASVHIF